MFIDYVLHARLMRGAMFRRCCHSDSRRVTPPWVGFFRLCLPVVEPVANVDHLVGTGHRIVDVATKGFECGNMFDLSLYLFECYSQFWSSQADPLFLNVYM